MRKRLMKYLSRQQRKVLIWCSRGWTNKEIANLFSLSVHTVDTYCERICKKLGARNIKHAIYIAMKLRLI